MKKIFSVLICILAAVFLLCSCGANVQKIDNSAHNTYPSFEGGTVYDGDTAGSASAENGNTQSPEISGAPNEEKTSQREEKTSETSAGLSEKTDKSAKTEKTDKPTSHAAGASQSKTEKEAKNKCTIMIECTTILQNYSRLKESKKEFVPKDGIILKKIETEFTDGESVFDVLVRVCKQKGIQTESTYTPGYGSYYVRGIHQIYEKDCGTKSGWMYNVNGRYPNYGCSSYILKNGDNICWRYTCDGGDDINAVLQGDT